jgi:hypothetical protein
LTDITAFDVVSAINAILGIIEKIHKSATTLRKKNNRSQSLKNESKKLLEDISKLIEKYIEYTDYLFSAISNDLRLQHQLAQTADNPLGDDCIGLLSKIENESLKNGVNIQILNRHLFEISSEIRIIIYSISDRLEGADMEKISKISDYCFQIYTIDCFTSVVFAKMFKQDDLIDKVSYDSILAKYKGHPANIPDAFGFEPDYDLLGYLNVLLMGLHQSKEKIAIALQDLS